MLSSLNPKRLPELELNLLEVAVKGNKVFYEFYKQHCGKWDINMHVLWQEFSLDFEHLEKQNDLGPLMKRARTLVSKLSSEESILHERALIISLEIMQMNRVAKEEDIKEFDISKAVWPESLLEGEPDHDLGDERLTIDRDEGKELLNIDREEGEGLPYVIRGYSYDTWEKLRLAEEKPPLDLRPCNSCRLSTRKNKKVYTPVTKRSIEPSSDSQDYRANEDILIFQNQKKSDATVTKSKAAEDESTPGYPSMSVSDTWGQPGQPGIVARILSIDEDEDILQPGSSERCSQDVLKLKDEPTKNQQSHNNKQHEQKVKHADNVKLIETLGSDSESGVLSNADCKTMQTVVLEKFPGDFIAPIEWMVDTAKYSAMNIESLRSDHDVLVEGVFGKMCKGNRLRWYHGFLLLTGVVVYFRKESKKMVFKKAADFRNSRVTLVNNKSLTVTTKERDFLLQFTKASNCDVWYQTILGISAESLEMTCNFTLHSEFV